MESNLKKELDCDILICGAGLAGLSLTYRALKSNKWLNAKIIILDNSVKRQNDKTWSFWKKGEVPFEELIYKTWNKLSVFSNSGEKINLNSGAYSYNSINSLDFYNYVLAFLETQTNVQFLHEEVLSLDSSEQSCIAETSISTIRSNYIFNSIYEQPALKKHTQYFLQHFKGVVIKSAEISMNTDEAFLMDFRTGQDHGTTFFYSLPISADKLFVEYTLFSKSLLKQEDYDVAIQQYIENELKLSEYEVLHTEFGVIPMTDHQFIRSKNRITNFGTIGGDTRGATGYTFINVQKTITNILEAWPVDKNLLLKEHISKKHKLYDAILLNVLDQKQYPGHKLFCDLFRNTDAKHIFKFLDAETSIIEDRHVIFSLNPFPFLKALNTVLRNKMV